MSELDVLNALNNRIQLVPKGTTEEELTVNAAAFTRAAAWELRADGWGNIRKDAGTAVAGLDVDKLLNRHTGQGVDIVVAAGTKSARVAWQPFEGRDILDRWIEPREFQHRIPVEPVEPDDVVQALIDLDATQLLMVDTLRDLVKETRRLNENFERGLVAANLLRR